MAEVYGVKPKKFTKEWWPYFWMYYKWHTISVIFVIFLVLLTAYQCATTPKYDLSMTYSGGLIFTDEMAGGLTADMAELIEDIDSNGERSIKFQCYTITGVTGSEEFDSAMRTKLDMEFYNENSYIFLLDTETMLRQFNNDYYGEIYDTVDIWADELPAEDKLYMIDGKAYAVSLKDSAYLTSKGYKTDDMYAVLKANYVGGELEEKAYEESKKILNELIK